MARKEAVATTEGVRFINQHLVAFYAGRRTLDSIKGGSKSQVNKDLVSAAICELCSSRETASDRAAPSGQPSSLAATIDGSSSSPSSTVPPPHSV